MAKRSRLRTQKQRRRRLVGLGVLTALLFCCVVLVYVNRHHFAPYLQPVSPNSGQLEAIEFGDRRGFIYDRNYKELANSLESVSVYARVKELESPNGAAAQLAPILGQEEEELAKLLRGDSLRIWLEKNISQEKEEAIRALNLPGIFLDRKSVRYYPPKELAAHVTGIADKGIGLFGVEHYYDDILNNFGVSRFTYQQRAQGDTDEISVGGQNLLLTVDLKIQKLLKKYVDRVGASRKKKRVAAIFMETGSGNVIASANYPSFDPNKFKEYQKETFDNILLAPVSLPDNLRSFFNTSSLLHEEYARNHRVTPWSVVAGPANIGGQLRLWEDIGLSARLPIDFADDDSRQGDDGDFSVPDFAGDTFGTVPSVATPVQLLTAFTRLVNGGKPVVPHVLGKVVDRQTLKEYILEQTDGSRQDVGGGEELSNEIIRLLNSQSIHGQSDSVFIEGQKISRQPADAAAGYVLDKVMVSTFPVAHPKLILLVVEKQLVEGPVSEQDDRNELSREAGKIITSMVALQEVLKSMSDMMTYDEKEERNYQQQQQERTRQQAAVAEEQPKLQVMPELIGLSLRKSLRLLQGSTVEIHVRGTGRVVAQRPEAGVSLDGVKECVLTLKKDEKHGFSIDNVKN